MNSENLGTYSREKALEEIEKIGGVYVTRIEDDDVLIVGDKAGSKIQIAQKLQIPFIQFNYSNEFICFFSLKYLV